VLRKLQKSSYDLEEMDRVYRGTARRWTDPDFNYEPLRVGSNTVEWRRADEIVDTPGLLSEELSPADVVQGWINNCYFLSAVACLTERPHRIRQLFEREEYNPNGYYLCRLTFNGVYQEVMVDDLFPVFRGSGHIRPVYAKPAQGRYLWVMVLEKCWAKLLKGYSNTNCTPAPTQSATPPRPSRPSPEPPRSSAPSPPSSPPRTWRPCASSSCSRRLTRRGTSPR
jgi:hypothetical protein